MKGVGVVTVVAFCMTMLLIVTICLRSKDKAFSRFFRGTGLCVHGLHGMRTPTFRRACSGCLRLFPLVLLFKLGLKKVENGFK